MKSKLDIACAWLNKSCTSVPVCVKRNGQSIVVAHLYQLKREGKPIVRYVVDRDAQGYPVRIRRI